MIVTCIDKTMLPKADIAQYIGKFVSLIQRFADRWQCELIRFANWAYNGSLRALRK